jgi:hypothetical protein
MQAVNNFFMLSTHVPPCILRAYSHTQRVSTRCRSAPALVAQCARASLYYPTLLEPTRGSNPRPVHVGRRHLRQSCHRFWRFWRSGRSTARGNRQGRHPGCCRCCSKKGWGHWGWGAQQQWNREWRCLEYTAGQFWHAAKWCRRGRRRP